MSVWKCWILKMYKVSIRWFLWPVKTFQSNNNNKWPIFSQKKLFLLVKIFDKIDPCEVYVSCRLKDTLYNKMADVKTHLWSHAKAIHLTPNVTLSFRSAIFFLHNYNYIFCIPNWKCSFLEVRLLIEVTKFPIFNLPFTTIISYQKCLP